MMASIRRGTGRAPARVTALVAALLVVACDDDPADPDPANAWEAELVGTGSYADVTGAAEVLSNSVAFAAEIAIEEAPADSIFDWAVVEGTCTQPGDVVGSASAYPDLDVAANGTAIAEADDDVSLAADDDYAVIVTNEVGTQTVTVACGNLERI